MTITANDVLEVLKDMDIDGLEAGDINLDESLLNQGMDSLDMMDLYFRLEETYGKKIEFDDDTTQHAQWSSITDITNGLNSL